MPLQQWIAKVNQAEAEAWQRGSGATRTDWSDQILGFDCGGQQWVKEVGGVGQVGAAHEPFCMILW